MIGIASSIIKASIDVFPLPTCGDTMVFRAKSKNVKRQCHSESRYPHLSAGGDLLLMLILLMLLYYLIFSAAYFPE